ncbi:DNA-directed RNA polymerase subunit A' [Candidatus Woesearchaeota archaeon]|nr:DNA-directed RNA polymerase subunit A' [Candidatus Woesearchaeota archaeon]
MVGVSKKIGSITFSLMSPKQIKKSASVKIVTPELYDKEGYPVDGGLMDVRLGVIDPGLRCKTCGEKLKNCTGHFGYMELARPVIHIKYVKIIQDLLRCTCRDCGRVMIAEDRIKKFQKELSDIQENGTAEDRRSFTKKVIYAIKSTKKCPHCGDSQKDIKIEKPMTFLEEENKLSPIEVRARLEKIPDADLPLLGLEPEHARPEWMVLTVLPIPPLTMRPSITLDTGERSEDDLTHKLGDIVRINQRLFENINAGAPEVIVEDLWDLLTYHITTYIDNSVPQVPPARHRSGQPLKTITARIKSKEGRFRHNLAGKRVNYAARAVISPDPEIEFNEVGVPQLIATELTVPERVTEWNIDWLKNFINNGPKKYPGANYVMKPDGKKKKITEETKAVIFEEIQPGYIVERHIMDGDIAIFNRQPSLHRMSIMCHKIKILPGRSFRLHPAVCNPYNADFDGDEMNLHIPQTEEARAEADILMQVQTQIMTPKNGTNIIGCVEDSITGCYMLTKGMTLSREDAVSLLASIGIDDNSLFESFGKEVEGKEVFSVLMPKELKYHGQAKKDTACEHCKDEKSKSMCPIHDVVIERGKLKCGVIDQKSIGEEGGGLIRELHRLLGAEKTIEIMGYIFKLGIAVLLKKGFTINLDEIELPLDVKTEINMIVEDTKKQVDEFIKEYERGDMETYPGKTLYETLEIKISQVLNNVRNKVGKVIVRTINQENSIIYMSKAGKGNILNIAMMASTVGQQALRGKRIQDGYRGRTLSLFKRGDLSPRSRGFIFSGYKQGLHPVEFYFAAMTGRDSLMDTALRTPKSGYLYRRLANALQDLKVEYDYTVRDANKTIVEFNYGDDNIDVSKSENGTINVRKIVEQVIMEGKK